MTDNHYIDTPLQRGFNIWWQSR